MERMNPARVACLVGVALVVVTSGLMAAGSASFSALLLIAWSLLPYAAVWLLTHVSQNRWMQMGGALAVLAGEIYVRYWLFFVARSSTSGLALLTSPLALLAALPVGAALGWSIGRSWQRSGATGRRVIAVTGAVCTAVAVLAVVRPSALPRKLGALVSTRERIGQPRVVTGVSFFRKTRLSSRSAWYAVGKFDDSSQTTIASIAYDGVLFLDPITGAEKSRLAFPPEAGRKWSWFSRLVRHGSDLLIVQTGGGYSDVEVLDFAGRPRWRFRPHPSLPPVALLPDDLDGDGHLEFYAAASDSVYRLDAQGKVVWTRTLSTNISTLTVARAENGNPALIAAVSTMSRAWTWDADGRPNSELTVPGDDYRYQLVDWPRGRALVGGGEKIRAIGVNGQRLFEHDLGDFHYSDAVALHLNPGGPPHLAVLAAAAKEVGRSRLMVFSPAGEIVYDEILPQHGSIMTAPDHAGREMLLLATNSLFAYRQ